MAREDPMKEIKKTILYILKSPRAERLEKTEPNQESEMHGYRPETVSRVIRIHLDLLIHTELGKKIHGGKDDIYMTFVLGVENDREFITSGSLNRKFALRDLLEAIEAKVIAEMEKNGVCGVRHEVPQGIIEIRQELKVMLGIRERVEDTLHRHCQDISRESPVQIHDQMFSPEEKPEFLWSPFRFHSVSRKLCHFSPFGLCSFNESYDSKRESCIFCERPHSSQSMGSTSTSDPHRIRIEGYFDIIALLDKMIFDKAAGHHEKSSKKYEFSLDQDVHLVSPGWHWDCDESPFGLCAYDKLDDPCWDSCIYCGYSHERK